MIVNRETKIIKKHKPICRELFIIFPIQAFYPNYKNKSNDDNKKNGVKQRSSFGKCLKRLKNLSEVNFGYFSINNFCNTFKIIDLTKKNEIKIKASKLFFIKFEVPPRKPNHILFCL
jgi:hypothetical protein